MNVNISALSQIPLKNRDFEIVERKGKGHPDTICDSLMDSMSVAISREYKKQFGTVLHHNLDKCLLTAGHSTPKFCGGEITEPIKIFMGDRATTCVGEKTIDIRHIMEDNGREWVHKNLRYVNSLRDVEFHSEVQCGSQNLADIFSRKTGKYLGANDTSATVGYYPFTPTEMLVKKLEAELNSLGFHQLFPMCGEDVKVMAYRDSDGINLTIAMAMVDYYIKNETQYFQVKDKVKEYIKEYVKETGLNAKEIYLNALDVKGRGTDGLYLTVSGTSAEAGDSGQVGRGNDVAGIIPLCRPMASEAAPGKNPVSHVGKIYNALCFEIAKKTATELESDEVYCWLLSQIGKPINEPAAISVQFISRDRTPSTDFRAKKIINEIIQHEFDHLDTFCDKLANGEIKLF